MDTTENKQYRIPDCPYGANDCPKVKAVKEKMGSINFKLNVLIAFVVVMHAADLIMLLRLIA